MDASELRRKFIVGADVLKVQLETLVELALKYCVVAENGTVLITAKGLSAKDKIKLVLTARALAAQLDSAMSPQVTTEDLSTSTGLPVNQIRARINDAVKERFATSPNRGLYVANPHLIEKFLKSLHE